MANRALNFSNTLNHPLLDALVAHPFQEAFRLNLTTTFKHLCTEMAQAETSELLHTWQVIHSGDPISYKVEAALSHVLFERKTPNFNKTVIKCLEFFEDPELLFSYLEIVPIGAEDEFVEVLHNILSIDSSQLKLLKKMPDKTLFIHLKFLSTMLSPFPLEKQKKILETINHLPTEIPYVIDLFSLLLNATEKQDELLEFLNRCKSDHMYILLYQATQWQSLVQDPDLLFPILQHLSTLPFDQLAKTGDQIASLFKGATKGKPMFDILCYFSSFPNTLRDEWIKELRPFLEKAPPEKKFEQLKKFIFVDKVLRTFKNPNFQIKPAKTPLKHIR